MKAIDLYVYDTPNCHKVSIALEEMQIPYNVHIVDIRSGEQHEEGYLKISPNAKVPAIKDPNAGDTCIFESGAVMLYLAEISGKFLPKDSAKKAQVMQWLFWQMAGIGPGMGQLFQFSKQPDGTAEFGKKRFLDESIRLLKVLDAELAQHRYLGSDEVSIADFATMPWIKLTSRYPEKIEKALSKESYKNIMRWEAELLCRKGVQKGIAACSAEE